jgi:hypothetical protein
MALKWPDKDPDEQLDYSIDWSRYLGDDTISSVVWYIEDADGVKQEWPGTIVTNELQHISSSNTNTVATIQLALGNNNTVYTIYCEVTTSAGVTTERKVRIRVQERS